jgi:hypothetical protein
MPMTDETPFILAQLPFILSLSKDAATSRGI